MVAQERQEFEIKGIIGSCGSRRVFLGFAPASLLHKVSFADVLDESSGTGYQRRFSREHSLEFRRYIQKSGSTTIPLTFNLRPTTRGGWKLQASDTEAAKLVLDLAASPMLAQVDCQHRLGHLADLDISLPFMTFLGLTIEEEMQVFNVINGKAKGLTSSLLDFHEAIFQKMDGVNRFSLSQKQNIRFFVEDDLGNAAKLAFVCDVVFLFHQPYNSTESTLIGDPAVGAPFREDLPNNVIRVTSWDEIYQHVRRLV